MPFRSVATGRSSLAWTMLVVAALAVVYAPSLSNGPVWDDRDLVTENPYLRDVRGLEVLWHSDLWTASAKQEQSSFYRPLAMTTYWVNAWIGGLTPFSIRTGNLLIHIANALLLLLLFKRRVQARVRGLGPVFVLLWGLAPLCSEPVFWLSGRFDLLVTLAALGVLILNERESPGRVVGVAAVIGAGLLCKENFLGWTPLLLVDDLVVHRRALRRLVVKYAAIAVVVAAYLAVRAHLGLKSVSILADHDPGTLLEAYLFAIHTFLPLLVFPSRLDPFHPYEGLSTFREGMVGLAVIGLTVLLSVRGLARQADPGARTSLEGWLWMLGALLPSALTGPTLMMIGDRYAYLPLVGLFLAAWPLVVRLEAWRTGPHTDRQERPDRILEVSGTGPNAPHIRLPARWSLPVLLAILALAEGWVTTARAGDWKDDESLARASLEHHPDSFYALYTLGAMAAQRGDYEEASNLLRRSLLRNDGSWRTWNAICYVLQHQNRLDDALEACRNSAAINPRNPRVWVNLASIFVVRKQWQEAFVTASRAVAIKPGYVNARYLAGVSAANLGNLDVALEHVQAGLQVDPTNPRLLALKQALDAAGPGRSDRHPTHTPAPGSP